MEGGKGRINGYRCSGKDNATTSAKMPFDNRPSGGVFGLAVYADPNRELAYYYMPLIVVRGLLELTYTRGNTGLIFDWIRMRLTNSVIGLRKNHSPRFLLPDISVIVIVIGGGPNTWSEANRDFSNLTLDIKLIERASD